MAGYDGTLKTPDDSGRKSNLVFGLFSLATSSEWPLVTVSNTALFNFFILNEDGSLSKKRKGSRKTEAIGSIITCSLRAITTVRYRPPFRNVL